MDVANDFPKYKSLHRPSLLDSLRIDDFVEVDDQVHASYKGSVMAVDAKAQSCDVQTSNGTIRPTPYASITTINGFFVYERLQSNGSTAEVDFIVNFSTTSQLARRSNPDSNVSELEVTKNALRLAVRKLKADHATLVSSHINAIIREANSLARLGEFADLADLGKRLIEKSLEPLNSKDSPNPFSSTQEFQYSMARYNRVWYNLLQSDMPTLAKHLTSDGVYKYMPHLIADDEKIAAVARHDPKLYSKFETTVPK